MRTILYFSTSARRLLLLLVVLGLFTPGIARAQAPTCFVCDSGIWRSSSEDDCTTDSPICRNNDKGSFEGCREGDAKIDAKCEDTSLDSGSGLPANTDIFSNEDSLRNALPHGTELPTDNCSGKRAQALCATRFWQEVMLPKSVPSEVKVEAPNPDSEVLAATINPLINIFLSIVSSFQQFFSTFASFTVKKDEGFLNNTVTSDKNYSKQGAPNSTIVEQATADLQNSIVPAGVNPNRNLGSSLSYIGINSSSLAEIINTASQNICVPESLLRAISRVEGEQTFKLTDEEVQGFSTPGWWNGASSDKTRKGYCYNTCSDPALGCTGQDVQGAMQFELRTWNSLLPQIKQVLVSNFGANENYTPNRCNLRDSIVGAAVKVKQDSQTGGQCSNWSENTVKYKVAQSYCGGGTCKASSACGADYCGNVWRLYNTYSFSR